MFHTTFLVHGGPNSHFAFHTAFKHHNLGYYLLHLSCDIAMKLIFGLPEQHMIGQESLKIFSDILNLPH